MGGMNRLYQQRYLIRSNLIPLIGLCLSVYFCYHLLQGNRSYLHLMSLNNSVKTASAEYDQLNAQRQALERITEPEGSEQQAKSKDFSVSCKTFEMTFYL